MLKILQRGYPLPAKWKQSFAWQKQPAVSNPAQRACGCSSWKGSVSGWTLSGHGRTLGAHFLWLVEKNQNVVLVVLKTQIVHMIYVFCEKSFWSINLNPLWLFPPSLNQYSLIPPATEGWVKMDSMFGDCVSKMREMAWCPMVIISSTHLNQSFWYAFTFREHLDSSSHKDIAGL